MAEHETANGIESITGGTITEASKATDRHNTQDIQDTLSDTEVGQGALEAEEAQQGRDSQDRQDSAEGSDGSSEESDSAVTWISPEVYGQTVVLGSPLHDATRHLQAQRFAQVQGSRSGSASTSTSVARPSVDEGGSYVEVTDYAPERTIPIAIFRAATPGTRAADDELVGTARLELAGATLIEQMIRLRPDSPVANAFAQQAVAEIGGFAVTHPQDRVLLLDVIDAIVAIACQVAAQRNLTTFLLFPRNGFMSLMRAEIDHLLPPYHFEWCHDVIGWHEESEQLARFRGLGLRGLGKYPDIFVISAETYAADLSARQALIPLRHKEGRDLDRLLPRAMMHAQRLIQGELAQWRGSTESAPGADLATDGADTLAPEPETLVSVQSQGAASFVQIDPESGSATSGSAGSAHNGHSPLANRIASKNFLPFGTSAAEEAQYLRTVVAQADSPAQAYKQLSFQLLSLERRMRVLDVGCGAGVDLPTLAAQVGDDGAVIGIDRAPAQVDAAKQLVADQHLANIWVYEGDAEHLTFATGEFDRIRADRAMQHMQHPDRALAEMWRVLRPGGVLTIIEPDWSSIVVSPASGKGRQDDRAVQEVLGWCRAHLAQPLIGRELHALLRRLGVEAWAEMQVVPQIYPFTNWATLDAVLRLSSVVDAMQSDGKETAALVRSWYDDVLEADQRGEFFAAVPLFFAIGRKAVAAPVALR